MLIKNCIIAVFMFLSFDIYADEIGIIEKIQFQGLEYISKNEALNYVPLSIGQTISDNDIQRSVNVLFKTGIFQDVKVFYSSNTITFQVKERPIISNILIEGNKIISTDMLNKYLMQLGIKIGSTLNPLMNHIFVKKLENYYKDAGKYQVHIQILQKVSFRNTVYLKIIIKENVATKIKKIKIIGNHIFSNDQLMSLFYLKPCNHCWNIWDNCIYYAKQFQQDLNNLKNFYTNRGYLNFSINSEKITFSHDKRNVDIRLNISEGEKYTISKIFIHSNCISYHKLIQDVMKIRQYEAYNQEKINLSINEIKNILSNDGYINAQVHVHPDIDSIKKTINLNFYIDKQKRYFVHNISFRGNAITQDIVLRREMKQKEGTYFNRRLVNLGKELLEKTQYFSDVQILMNLVSSESNQIDIIYLVKENQTGSLNFSMGYGLDSGMSSQISFSQNNLFGSGNTFQAQIIKNSYQKYLDIIMENPYLISNNIHVRNRFFYNDYKDIQNNMFSSIKNNYGIESNLGLVVSDFNRLNLGVGYTHNNILHVRYQVSVKHYKNASSKKLLKNITANDIALNYAWIYDDIKYVSFPVSGKKISISGKNTIFRSDNFFYKFMLDSTQFIPLNKDNTFLLFHHFYIGLANIFNTEKLPFYENFYANHINNVRGFQSNTIGPKSRYFMHNNDICTGYEHYGSCQSIESIGGNAMMMMNLEFIFPMSWLEKTYSNYLRSSLFLDLGSVWNTDIKKIHDFKIDNLLNYQFKDNLHVSSGIALQWLSPIGPVVFSYAHPLFVQKNYHYQMQPFQFNIGRNW